MEIDELVLLDEQLDLQGMNVSSSKRAALPKENENVDMLNHDFAESEWSLVFVLTLGVMDTRQELACLSSDVQPLHLFLRSSSMPLATQPAIHLYRKMSFDWLVSLLSLVISSDEGYTQRVQYKSENHHIIQLSSLLPSASCTPSSTGGIRESSLEVVHKHGPCSPHTRTKPNTLNHTKTLVWDQSRVDSIQSKISTSSSNNTNKGPGLGSSKATVPAKLGIPFDSLEYIVTVGLGSTRSKLTLIFNTSSDLTWTQCEPCSFCYPQSEPIFSPSHSSSYANTPCTSPMCRSSGSGILTSCSHSRCSYQATYGDLSYSYGNLATDTLMLMSTDVVRNFQFGCGRVNYGSFGGTASLLGLTRDGLSIVRQTASKYGRYFSYCLPSSSSSKGYLTFGKTRETPKPLTFTPIAAIQESSMFRGINIVEIAVARTKLQIPSAIFSKAEALIDSGTVVT
ncbi:aspartyl protease family protein At5g10770-like [Rhodamnia argentea]|uniref:Aspartyl protease family protein At5g10770-like n=1 Tax=Rhodamnia argentea TaxID=178133 RepID=A0ABM3HCP9_9MYRT|nr:aspartyl protease family protein At5g10770-like [Rhodamnia argentea]